VSRPLFVKICGITSAADALAAVRAGADAVGFNFDRRSIRLVCLEDAAAISRVLPRPRPLRVGVFANASLEEIASADARVGLDVIQLHGDEDPGLVAAVGPKAMKTIRLAGAAPLGAWRSYRCHAFLLDGSGRQGDGGEAFDWSVARAFKGVARVVISGGLTPENVEAAVAAAQPYGVDVVGGVESSPGVKDEAKLWRFIERARGPAARRP
jgi:phosphoribosylanthranilate isomerase